MHFIILFLLILAILPCKISTIEIPEIDRNLHQQVLNYDPKLTDSYYCRKIPLEDFLEFLDIYEKRPIYENEYGMRSNGIFFLWHLIKEINPSLVIESGIYRGQTTWIIDQAAPQAKIIAIDPRLQDRIYISKNAFYTTEDFSLLSIETDSNKSAVCFFDDHKNAFERVLQANSKGIKHLIFDDNYPPGCDDACENPHLTLRDCFEMYEHKEKAALLKKIVKHYYIMPQIVGKTAGNFLCGHSPVTNLPSIWGTLEEIDSSFRGKMKTYYEDSLWYRWVTYIELN